MKNYVFILTFFLLFSCNDAVDINNIKNLELKISEEDYLNDFDFQQVIKLDDFVKREIIRGTFSSHKNFISEQLKSKVTYCNILDSNSLEGDLLHFIEAKCERSKHFNKLVSKYPSYLKMASIDKVLLRKKAEKLLDKELTSEEAFNLFKSKNNTDNE